MHPSDATVSAGSFLACPSLPHLACLNRNSLVFEKKKSTKIDLKPGSSEYECPVTKMESNTSGRERVKREKTKEGKVEGEEGAKHAGGMMQRREVVRRTRVKWLVGRCTWQIGIQ